MHAPGLQRPLGPLALVLAIAGGCEPLSAPGPFHFMETADVLQRGEVSLQISGGVGSALFDGNAGGGGARLRAGVGARQELGVEATVLSVGTGTRAAGDPPWVGQSIAYSAKLAYKAGPTDWLAVLIGAGGSTSATGVALGGDLALLFSPPESLRWPVRPYGAVRGSMMAPLGRGLADAGGVTAALIPAGGLAILLAPRLQFFVEVGGLFGWSSSHDTKGFFDAGHAGAYGGGGFTLVLGRPR